jgi:hypothetical protein
MYSKEWVKAIWRSESTSSLPDTYKAKRLARESYDCGLIGWNTYNSALAKIQTVQNGNWMFEKQKSP